MTIIAVLGPTAAGKSRFAEALAARIGAKILSVDSMQVFRGMDIGTAKPDRAARERFVYHMVDVANPADEYTVAEFQAAGRRILDDAADRSVPVVVAGGSGLHFRSLVDPLTFPPTDETLRVELESTEPAGLVDELLRIDPQAGAHVDLANPRRVLRAVEIFRLVGASPSERAATADARAVRAYRPVRPFVGVGIDPGPMLGARIEQRLAAMLDAGFLDEVAALAPRMGRTARQAVGYREMMEVIEDTVDPATGRDNAVRATNALAKRQRTYFRRDPRIRWIPWHHDVDRMVEGTMEHHEEGLTWTF